MVKGEMLVKLGRQHANAFKSLLYPFRVQFGSWPFLGLGKVGICADAGTNRANRLTPDFTKFLFLRPKTAATQW